MRVFGVRGCGSAITEAMLVLVGQGYEYVDVAGAERPGRAREVLAAVNPLLQVPALELDDGTILTETAAITLYLADRHVGLAPAPGTAGRIRFQWLLIWLVANVYPTFTYGDRPERWTASAPGELDRSTARHRETLYRWLEGQVGEPFVLGPEVGALDLYLAVMVAWHPRLDWFRRNTPRLAAIAERTRRLPAVAPVMVLNGW